MANSPRLLKSSVRLYETLLRVYPAAFRQAFGEEMALVFREHLSAMWQARGTRGLLAAWFHVLGDLLRSAPHEHWSEIQRSLGMKNGALALISVVLAAFAHMVLWMIGTILVLFPVGIDLGRSTFRGTCLVILYLAAFLTGVILARTKPFVWPRLTVPLGTVAVWGLAVVLDGPPVHSSWGLHAAFVATMGLAALLGCLAAPRIASLLARISVPWFQLTTTLAILVSTAAVYCILRIAMLGDQFSADMRRAIVFCLFALALIAVATITNLVVLIVRTAGRRGGVPPASEASLGSGLPSGNV